MIKRTIILCIGYVFCFFLSFIIIYSILSFKLNSNNSALILSIFFALILSAGISLAENVLFIKKEQKDIAKKLKNEQLCNLISLSDEEFFRQVIKYKNIQTIGTTDKYLITKDQIFFNIRQYLTVTKDQILELIRIKRTYPEKSAFCYIIAPIDASAMQLMKENKIALIENSEIEDLAAFSYTNENMLPKSSKSRGLITVLYDKKLTRKCFKTAFSLIVVSIFTYNKALYILLSAMLVLLGILSFILRRRNTHSKTMV